MKLSPKMYYFCLFIFFIPFSTQGQSENPNRFYFELEPLQFVNSGWSIVGHYSLSSRLQIGTNAFASVLSEGLNGLVWNADEGLDLLAEQDFGINVSLRYFLKEHSTPQGWMVSLPLGWETWKLNDQMTEQAKTYRFWYLSPRIGYLWFPFQKEYFYMLGEAVVILPIQRDEARVFDNRQVEIRSIVPFPSVGLGILF